MLRESHFVSTRKVIEIFYPLHVIHPRRFCSLTNLKTPFLLNQLLLFIKPLQAHLTHHNFRAADPPVLQLQAQLNHPTFRVAIPPYLDSAPTMPLLDLPDETLLKITEHHLSEFQDTKALLPLMQSSRQLRRIASPLIFRTLKNYGWNTLTLLIRMVLADRSLLKDVRKLKLFMMFYLQPEFSESNYHLMHRELRHFFDLDDTWSEQPLNHRPLMAFSLDELAAISELINEQPISYELRRWAWYNIVHA